MLSYFFKCFFFQRLIVYDFSCSINTLLTSPIFSSDMSTSSAILSNLDTSRLVLRFPPVKKSFWSVLTNLKNHYKIGDSKVGYSTIPKTQNARLSKPEKKKRMYLRRHCFLLPHSSDLVRDVISLARWYKCLLRCFPR